MVFGRESALRFICDSRWGGVGPRLRTTFMAGNSARRCVSVAVSPQNAFEEFTARGLGRFQLRAGPGGVRFIFARKQYEISRDGFRHLSKRRRAAFDVRRRVVVVFAAIRERRSRRRSVFK